MKTYIVNLIRKASTKGDNSRYSLFVLEVEDFPKMGLTLKGKNLIFGEQILSLKCWPRWEGRQTWKWHDRVVSPERVPDSDCIHSKRCYGEVRKICNFCTHIFTYLGLWSSITSDVHLYSATSKLLTLQWAIFKHSVKYCSCLLNVCVVYVTFV